MNTSAGALLVLGVETSCDETGVALYDCAAERLLGHVLHSQIALHGEYGGVVPELASRDHIRRLLPLMDCLFAQTGRALREVGAIAYTQGPGLAGALLVGSSVAQGLGAALEVPVLAVHHMEGHLLSPLLAEPKPEFPFVALLVSGGHTELLRVRGFGDYELLGETVDDAAGEAFDKTAKLLGLPYPGGPALAELARSGVPTRYSLPRPMLASGDFNFSFSGLKTAVATVAGKPGFEPADRADLAASFQAAIVEVLVAKAIAAAQASGERRLVVAGGVGANRQLREVLALQAARDGIETYYPPLALCTDNGAMIALAGALALKYAATSGTTAGAFSVRPRWSLDSLAARG